MPPLGRAIQRIDVPHELDPPEAAKECPPDGANPAEISNLALPMVLSGGIMRKMVFFNQFLQNERPFCNIVR